jgi:hypothetical protein
MVTNKDIVAALEGRPSASRAAADEAIHNAFSGGPTPTQKAHTNAVLEALGVARPAVPGELPLKKRGDFGEATAIWAAKEAATTSTKGLAEAIMRADGSKGIYLAEAEAKEIAAEAYAEAAKRTPYEEIRQEAVARHTARIAGTFTRNKISEAGRSNRIVVNESLRLSESATPDVAGSMSLKIIDAGRGSSGVYPAATLEKAAKAKVFAKGLHLYMNHPSPTEDYDRPERSVHDLAGVLASDAVYRNGGLYAEAVIYPKYKDQLTAMAADIGVSIRASAEKEQDGTISEIYQAHSVDFVTRPGRGGAILSVN